VAATRGITAPWQIYAPSPISVVSPWCRLLQFYTVRHSVFWVLSMMLTQRWLKFYDRRVNIIGRRRTDRQITVALSRQSLERRLGTSNSQTSVPPPPMQEFMPFPLAPKAGSLKPLCIYGYDAVACVCACVRTELSGAVGRVWVSSVLGVRGEGNAEHDGQVRARRQPHSADGTGPTSRRQTVSRPQTRHCKYERQLSS